MILFPSPRHLSEMTGLYEHTIFHSFSSRTELSTELPPFSRSEKVADYEAECRPIQCSEDTIRSMDGIKINLLLGVHSTPQAEPCGGRKIEKTKKEKHCVILCFR
jgi:hypothetical protein